MLDLLVRFLAGGCIVSLFAMIGDVLEPKSFAGLFGAAPSVALASLGLTISSSGTPYAAMECRSMLIGAIGFACYSAVLTWLLVRGRLSPMRAAFQTLGIWFAVTLGLWLTL